VTDSKNHITSSGKEIEEAICDLQPGEFTFGHMANLGIFGKIFELTLNG
jgi:hypothetical protein